MAQTKKTAKDIKDAKPSGTVEIDAEQIALIIGGAQGKGVLTFQGKQYPFTFKGGSAGASVGASKLHATGNGYFLNKIEDFPGQYSAVSTGGTLGVGGGVSQFENGKGVFISLRGKTEGAALNLGVTVATVTLTK